MSDEKPAANPPMPRVEGMETTPELFVDGYQGVLVGNGLVKLNLFAEMADSNDGAVRRIGAARLTMSIANLVGLHHSLSLLLADFEEKGILVRTPGPTETRQ